MTPRRRLTLLALLSIGAPALSMIALVPEPVAAQQHTATAVAKDSSSDEAQDDDSDSDDDATSTPDEPPDAGRVVDFARMLKPGRDLSRAMPVDVQYASGTLTIGAAPAPYLYDVRVTGPAERNDAIVHYDTLNHALRVSASEHHDVSVKLGDGGSHEHGDQNVRIGLAPGVPLELALEFGAGDLRANLGGLSIRRLNIRTGATDAEVHFREPNPIAMESMDIAVGAAGFVGTGFGNARARSIMLRAGAGDVDLDFSGQWNGNVTLDVTAALGAVHVHVPPDVVVDNAARVIIGSMDNAGAATPSANGRPTYHLHLVGTATLGSVEVDRKVRQQ